MPCNSVRFAANAGTREWAWALSIWLAGLGAQRQQLSVEAAPADLAAKGAKRGGLRGSDDQYTPQMLLQSWC